MFGNIKSVDRLFENEKCYEQISPIVNTYYKYLNCVCSVNKILY